MAPLVQTALVLALIAGFSAFALSGLQDRRDALMAEQMTAYLRDAVTASFLMDGDGVINTGTPPRHDGDSDCRKAPGWTPPTTPRLLWAEVAKTANLVEGGEMARLLAAIYEEAELDPENGTMRVSLAAANNEERVLLARMAADNGLLGTSQYDTTANTLVLEFRVHSMREGIYSHGLHGPGLRHLASAVPFGGPLCSSQSQTLASGYHYDESGSPEDYDKWDWTQHPWAP